MKKLFWIMLALAVSGCAAVRAQKMEESMNLYKQCLAANPKKPAKCEAERLTYENDVLVYQSTGSGVLGIGSGNNNLFPAPQAQPNQWMMNQGGRTYNCNNIGGTVNCF